MDYGLFLFSLSFPNISNKHINYKIQKLNELIQWKHLKLCPELEDMIDTGFINNQLIPPKIGEAFLSLNLSFSQICD